MPTPPTDYPIVHCADTGDWAAWLEQQHADSPGVWLRIAKGGAPLQSVRYADAVDVALCYGWIDGQARRWDDESYIQKFTPRRKRSIWSKRNRERVERLTASGEMRPAGLAAVEAARADGRWERAYDSPAGATVPADLRAALDANADAGAAFDALDTANRYAILHRIQTALKPETRARRIAHFVAMLQRGEKPHR